MLLQRLLFPRADICEDKRMYYHSRSGDCKVSEDHVKMVKGDILECDTYFNAFSLGKWQKYTLLDNLGISLTISGDYEINLCGVYINDVGTIIRVNDCVPVVRRTSGESEEIKLQFNLGDYSKCPLIYVQIRAFGDTTLYSGFYYTDVEGVASRSVKALVGICTYKRESFVVKNIRAIEKYSKESPILRDSLDLLVCDNARTLPASALTNSRVRVIKNKNCGGSGGFTRCIMEALSARDTKGYTHILLMDDDIVLDAAVLERTISFLNLLKQKYENIAIGGAMLFLDRRNRQFENGATFTKDGMLKFQNKGLELTGIRNIIVNDSQDGDNYNAWCYCCMPLSKIDENNLPLPLFVHMDDVEFGVRNKFEFVHLNGICVWHPSAPNMRSTSVAYYDIRNKLIASSSVGDVDLEKYAIKWLDIFRSDVAVYNYNRFLVVCLAIQDYLRGIDAFKATDPVALNEHLRSYNVEWKPAELKHLRNITQPSKVSGLKRWVWAIGNHILPAYKSFVAMDCDISEADPYRTRKLYICDTENKKEKEFKKSLMKALLCAIQYMKVRYLIRKKIKSVGDEWRSRITELQSWAFWTEYLK